MKSLSYEDVRLYGETMADLVKRASAAGLESGFGGFDVSAQFKSTMISKLKLLQMHHGSDADPEPLRARLDALRVRQQRIHSSRAASQPSRRKSLATAASVRLWDGRRIVRGLVLTSLVGLTMSLLLRHWPWQAWAILPLLGILIELIPFHAAAVRVWAVLSAAFFWCMKWHL